MSSYDDTTPQVARELGDWLANAAKVPSRDSSDGGLRHAVIAGVQQRQRQRRRNAVIGAVAMASLSLFVGVKLYRFSSPAPMVAIGFQVMPTNQLGQVGAYVAPSSNSSLSLRFTEGSVVELEPGARARVAATTARGATVLLETGRADVEVAHRKNADWTIMAGPYSVRVHGTAFSVEFDPTSQLFELVMRNGVVSVEGPGISKPVEIRGAQRFVHRAGLGSDVAETETARGAELSSKNAADDLTLSAGTVPSAARSAVDSIASIGGANRNAATVSSGVTSAAPSWETLVRRGEYAAVLAAAESRGLSSVYSGAGASELMALANAARFLGRVDVGHRAYQAIRQRFGGTKASATSAFLLGRLSESTSPSEARRWYERYEQEAPNGTLVAEAMGRRLVLTQASGGRAEVQRLADDYLRRFPDGPYAGVARKITSP